MKGSGSLLGKLGAAIGLITLTSLAACGARNAEAAFASDFKCDEVTSEETMATGRYRVTGCGHEVTYQCAGNYQEVCAIQMVDQGRSASSDEHDRPPPRRVQRMASEVQVDSSGNEAVMVLELVLDGKALLRITATPDKRADLVQFKVIRREAGENVDECNLDFMLNGQVIKTPKAVAARKGDVLSHRVQVGRDLIADFGTSEKIALRICRERWGLNREQVQKVRDFMDLGPDESAAQCTTGSKDSQGNLMDSSWSPLLMVSQAAPRSSI